jgi:hypothetical protein
MPVRKKLARAAVQAVDPINAFSWSARGDGCDHVLGEPHFKTQAEARRAWERHRRAVWAITTRFTLPGPAVYFDGLSLSSLDFVRSRWNHVAFDLSAFLAAVAFDRERLEAFRRTGAGRQVEDYLRLLARDLQSVEDAARELAAYPTGTFRPYPKHLQSSAEYGEAQNGVEVTR